MQTDTLTLTPGEEVVKASGELSATVREAIETHEAIAIDQQEVQGWFTTIFKALIAAIK